jgi:co-chaperonin GroES (HSP10)|tara:strand:+ start:1345 stop:1605 length:261 start_codon:yes stop_codon:yes gene_type:complete
MKAVGNYLVIEEVKQKPTKTKGGLLLTDKIKEDIRYRQGVVKSVGSLVQGVKANDNIYYDKHAGFNVEIDENIFLVIKQQDVVIVL